MEHIICHICGGKDGILDDIVRRILSDENIKVADISDMEHMTDCLSGKNSCLLLDYSHKKLPEEYMNKSINKHKILVIELLNNGNDIGVYMSNIGVNEIVELIKNYASRIAVS